MESDKLLEVLIDLELAKWQQIIDHSKKIKTDYLADSSKGN